jgi:membrane protein required for colicin V production
MNWIDAVLMVLLLAMVIVGAKKGMIRELMALGIFVIAIIVAINYVDQFAVWVHENIGGSPLVSAFLSFIILLAAGYVAFKLIGILFYKIADIKASGKRDQMGGALVGFLRGWILIGFVTFIAFLLPLPTSFYTSFEQSFLGPAVAKTIPLMYEGTSLIHPNNPNFFDKIEKTLLIAQSKSNSEITDEERDEIFRALQQLHQYFNTNFDGA